MGTPTGSGRDSALKWTLVLHRFLELGRSLLAGIRDRRQDCLLRVHFRLGDRLCIGRALDISPGGLFLECPEPLAPGAVLKLEVQLSRPAEQGEWIFCTGER